MCINSITFVDNLHIIKYKLPMYNSTLVLILGVDKMEKLASVIENNYGFKVYNITKVKNAYKIDTDQGLKCFKHSNYDIKQYEFIIGAMQYLINNGYKHILNLQSTVNGEKYIENKYGFGFICDWIKSNEVNFDNEMELKLSIECLSELHIASRGFKFDYKCEIRNLYGKWIKRFKRRCDELLYFKAIIKNKYFKSEFDRLYLSYFDEYYSQALKAVREFVDSKYFQIMEHHRAVSGFCHHDTANHNFLITPHNKIFLIDFDYCVYDSNLHDLASILIRNLRHGNWCVKRMAFILEIYNNNNKLNRDEADILRCFIAFPQDFWQIGLQYYIEKQKWEEEIFLKRLNRILDDTLKRKEFLKDLEGGIMFDFIN